MSQYLNPNVSNGVSIDLSNSWAAKSLQEALRQAQDPSRDYSFVQARFQQRQMQEKEEKLLRLYENQQQRAFDKVSRGSSGGSSVSGGTSPVGLGATLGASGAGRVRQMFDERRQKAGIDRSYPLEPLKQTTRLNGHVPANRVASLDRTMKNPTNRNSTMTVKTSVQRTVSQSTNGKPLKSRTVQKTNQSSYANGKLVEENSYEERNDNDHAVNMMKLQQKELEMMMNNHNLNDSIDDEEMPSVEIDEIDSRREEFSPSPDENEIYIDRKSNENYRQENTSTGSTPTRNISNNNRASPTVKKTVTKTTSITKPPARTSAEDKKRPSAMSAMRSATPRQPPATRMQPQISARSNQSARTNPRSGQQTTANDNLSPCKFCQRRFQTDRLGKHEEICARTSKKKRKTYDAVKHRVEGTDVEGYARKGPKGTSVKISKPPQMPKTDWRRQHEEFIATIRAAKMAQAHVAAGGKLSDLPPPPPSLNPDYVQCPHCGRRFNEAAAARHIPKCATMIHNKPNPRGPPPKKRF